MLLVLLLFEGKPDEKGGITLNTEMIYYLSRKIGKNWKRFARNLEMADHIIDEIDANEDNVSLEDKCKAVIKKFGYDVELKWNQIKDVLMEIGIVSVAVEFEEKFLS